MSSPDSVRRAVLRVIMIRMDSRITITVRTQQGPVMAHMETAGCRTAARIRTVLEAIITALMKTGRDRALIHMVIVRVGMVLMETSRGMQVRLIRMVPVETDRSMRVVLERIRMILMETSRGIWVVRIRMIPVETDRSMRVVLERTRMILMEIDRSIRAVHARMIPMETSRGIRVERIRIIPTEISSIKAVVRSSRIYTVLMQRRPGRIIPG